MSTPQQPLRLWQHGLNSTTSTVGVPINGYTIMTTDMHTFLPGVDVDFEDFDAMKAGTATSWLVDFTKALRADLPQDTYILTHARKPSDLDLFQASVN